MISIRLLIRRALGIQQELERIHSCLVSDIANLQRNVTAAVKQSNRAFNVSNDTDTMTARAFNILTDEVKALEHRLTHMERNPPNVSRAELAAVITRIEMLESKP